MRRSEFRELIEKYKGEIADADREINEADDFTMANIANERRSVYQRVIADLEYIVFPPNPYQKIFDRARSQLQEYVKEERSKTDTSDETYKFWEKP